MVQDLNGKKVIIFGGSGFIGSHLISDLCKNSCQIEVVTRKLNINSNHFFGNEPGQIKYKYIANYDQQTVDKLTLNADLVINLIGILFETKKNSFEFAHTQIPLMIAKACSKNKVRNFIHISALNINKASDSSYAISKLNGEIKIKENFKNALIIRPGVVFGKGDNFTNFFYKLSKFSPFLPLIGTPEIKTKKSFLPSVNFKKRVLFQPIYVGDLVDFIIAIIFLTSKTFEVTGPVICSFDEIFDDILETKKMKRLYIPIPFFLASLIAIILENLPYSLLTRDQIKLMKVDSTSLKGIQTLKRYVKNPTSIKSIVDTYL